MSGQRIAVDAFGNALGSALADQDRRGANGQQDGNVVVQAKSAMDGKEFAAADTGDIPVSDAGGGGASFKRVGTIPTSASRAYDGPAIQEPDWLPAGGVPMVVTTPSGEQICWQVGNECFAPVGPGSTTAQAPAAPAPAPAPAAQPVEASDPSPSQDNVLGNIVGVFETAVTVAGNTVANVAGSLAGVYNGFTNGKYGTPEGVREASARADQVTRSWAFHPSTHTAQYLTKKIGTWVDDSGIIGVGLPELNSLQSTTALAIRNGRYMPIPEITPSNGGVPSMAAQRGSIGFGEGARNATAAPINPLLPPADQPLLLTYTPTTNTLAQVRNMPYPQRWQAGEQYVQELYGSPGQQHFDVPAGPFNGEQITGNGGRFVDAPVSTADGGVIANEVKTYKQWTTVQGQPTQQTVPLSPQIQQQVLKDSWLQTNVSGYDPRWIFLDAGPSMELGQYLTNQGITYVVHH